MVFELFFYCVTVQTKNILKHKSALVMGICTTFTCFQNFRPRKRGFLHKTGFPVPHRNHFDGSSEWKELRFRLLETEANTVIYLHSKYLNRVWLLAQGAHVGHVRDGN